MAISLSDILSALQNGVIAIQGLNNRLATTFLQQGTIVSTGSSATIAANSTITFTSSQVAAFQAITTSSGVTYYFPLYR